MEHLTEIGQARNVGCEVLTGERDPIGGRRQLCECTEEFVKSLFEWMDLPPGSLDRKNFQPGWNDCSKIALMLTPTTIMEVWMYCMVKKGLSAAIMRGDGHPVAGTREEIDEWNTEELVERVMHPTRDGRLFNVHQMSGRA